MTTFTRPDPGIFRTMYPPAVFYICPDHPDAGALVVMVVTDTEARMDDAVCPECGRNLCSNAGAFA